MFHKNWNVPFVQFHKSAIQYEESTEKSLLEVVLDEEMSGGINIITDARHGWRHNAKDTSAVATAEKTYKLYITNMSQNKMTT